jgi:adenylate cyclase, class 2
MRAQRKPCVFHPNLSNGLFMRAACICETIDMSGEMAIGKMETEVKVRLTDRASFTMQLPALGFHLQTAETMERNVLFDKPNGELRQRGELLRIRQYGDRWILTHKAPVESAANSSHKVRAETETEIEDGRPLAAIFERLGFAPTFVYEKLRTEWADNEGHVVVDVTPIGDFAELEGSSEWIDRVAAKLGISPGNYMKASYGQLFQEWKRVTGHPAVNMTFAEIGHQEAHSATR